MSTAKARLSWRSRRGLEGSHGGCSGGGVVRSYGIMYAMRPLRNFKTNQCCHLISRIANCAKLDLIDFKPATNVLRFRDMGGSEDE